MLTELQKEILIALDSNDQKLESVLAPEKDLFCNLIRLKIDGILYLSNAKIGTKGQLVWDNLYITGKGRSLLNVIKG